MSSERTSTVVGIDIGGSKTFAARADADGTVIITATAGSANFESVSLEAGLREIDAIFDSLGRTGIDVVCVGSAGINTPEQESDLALLIGTRAPGARVIVSHDTPLILAAAELDSGIAIVCGTGSVAWGRAPDGRVARAGGWGYLLGDEGSGYWVTKQAVRHVLQHSDSGLLPDALSTALVEASEAVSAYGLLSRFYAEPSRRYWAQRASIVFTLAAKGDPICRGIVAGAATAIVELVTSVATHLDVAGPVVLGGGLVMNQPTLDGLIRDQLADQGITDVRVLDREPVYGALYLARRALSDTAAS